ncbi:SCO family protein [Pontibacter sp. 172403-2]|uniref:SCO family protein n=1 Tax=Pontibacter rufus TaxID=2791028 RepID=UPI0018AF7E49|nr:SCO family protein [Pontibacter sp. 172403-2]MBF9255040.1 SCO family protein [Pontibacter sp. 172403-2]
MNRNNNKPIFERLIAVLALSALLLYGCDSKTGNTEQTLPILGERQIVERQVNGQTVEDTAYFTIPRFAFVDQDSQQVTNQTFDNKVYVTDFFFTTCPSICPKMKTQMLRVYDKYKDNPDVLLLSHTIDPEHDSVAVLKDFAERLGVSSDKWHFVTGDRDSIYAIAEKYLVPVQEDAGAPGNFTHGGHFMLIDGNRHIRGVYDGTDPAEVDQLMNDIPLLLKETRHEKK